MDLHEIISDLSVEKQKLDHAIALLERLAEPDRPQAASPPARKSMGAAEQSTAAERMKRARPARRRKRAK